MKSARPESLLKVLILHLIKLRVIFQKQFADFFFKTGSFPVTHLWDELDVRALGWVFMLQFTNS